MRKAVYSLLLAGLFVLMLSALVVTPETADAPPAARLPADFHAAFRPLVPALLPEAANAASLRPDVRIALAGLLLPVPCALIPVIARDANGRVLCSRRYENSVYQLFRPEVAGG